MTQVALLQAVLGMFGYITNLDRVEVDDAFTAEFEVSGATLSLIDRVA
jgi:hypothetical protein